MGIVHIPPPPGPTDHKGLHCPHCQMAFFGEYTPLEVGNDSYEHFTVLAALCPSCERAHLRLLRRERHHSPPRTSEQPLFPLHHGLPPCPKEVPPELASDYDESCLVLPFSPKSSAALSRRCLERLLSEHAGANQKNLAQKIDHVLSSRSLPHYLADALDQVRVVGNFAAHTMKSTHSGKILEVEPGEAQENITVLASLFEHYFVAPAALARRRALIDAKLNSAGKPPTKRAPK